MYNNGTETIVHVPLMAESTRSNSTKILTASSSSPFGIYQQKTTLHHWFKICSTSFITNDGQKPIQLKWDPLICSSRPLPCEANIK